MRKNWVKVVGWKGIFLQGQVIQGSSNFQESQQLHRLPLEQTDLHCRHSYVTAGTGISESQGRLAFSCQQSWWGLHWKPQYSRAVKLWVNQKPTAMWVKSGGNLLTHTLCPLTRRTSNSIFNQLDYALGQVRAWCAKLTLVSRCYAF